MRPAPFRYFAPENAQAALRLLAEHGENARLLAGGQSLVPLMNLRMGRPQFLVDLGRCADLAYIEKRVICVAYGAMTRQIDAQNSPLTARHCPLVAQGLAFAGPIAIRNRATVGGTLSHADRTAELPAVAVAMEATFVIDGAAGGRREVAAGDFFQGDLTTDVKPGEMLREVCFPLAEPGAFSTFQEVGTRARDLAIAGLAAYLVFAKDVIAKARLAIIGVGPAPLRLVEAENLLTSQKIDETRIQKAAAAARAAVDPLSDIHASAQYRRHVTGSLVAKALQEAMRRGR
jgi:carbon-monoxide dehydrogenase medium subunit